MMPCGSWSQSCRLMVLITLIKVSINAAKNRKETESDKESWNGDETMDERDHADNIKPFQVSNKCFSTGNSNLQNTANITL